MAVNLSFIGGAGWQFFDNSGDPLSGGKIFTYAAGSTTPQTTYTSRDGLTPNANPIILDAAGRTPQEIWSTEGLLYKYVVTTSTNILIRTWDNIGGSVVASNLAQDLAAPTGSTLVGLTGYKGQIGTVDDLADADGSDWIGFTPTGASATPRSAQDKARDFVSVKDFGAIGNGVADDTAAFNAALAATSRVYVPRGTYNVSSTINVPRFAVLWGDGANSVINAVNISGSVLSLTAGNGPYEVCGLRITGIATTGVTVSNAQLVTMHNIALGGLTATRGFVFKSSWASSYRDLWTSGAAISDVCFAVGQDFNANDCANWYTSNFCNVNVLLDGGLDGGIGASHGSNFQNITVQGGDIGLFVKQYQGASFDTVYEENTVLPVKLGDHTLPQLARSITIRNLNTEGPLSSHPDFASRGAVVFFSYAVGCRIETADLGAAYNLVNSVPVTITGTGSDARAAAIVNHAGVIVGVQVVHPGFGYTSATVSFGGSGVGATATVSLLAGAVTAINLTSGGSGYAPADGCIATYQYHTAYKCVVDAPYFPTATGLFNPTWPWLVRASGAVSNAAVCIRNDTSGSGAAGTAELVKNESFSWTHALITYGSGAAPALITRQFVPVVL